MIEVQAPTRRWIWVVLGCAVFLLLFGRGMMREFDLDEHQFVTPGVLLDVQGAEPYRDYPYFHTPLLVYVYALAVKWVSMKLLAARLVNVLCGMGLVVAVFAAGWRMLRDAPRRTRWVLAGGVAATFMCSRLFAYVDGRAWNHESSVLAAFGAFLAHVAGLRSGRVWWFMLAGLLLGMSLSIRLSAAVAALPLVLSVVWARSTLTGRGRAAGVGLWLAGFAMGLLPAIGWWVAEPRQFVFGTVEYQGLWRMYAESLHSGRMTMLTKIGNFWQSYLTDPGNAVILGLLLAGVVLLVRQQKASAGQWWRRTAANDELLLLGGVLAALWVGAAAPAQMQYQYHFLLLPFLAWGAVAVLARWPADGVMMGQWVKWGGVACAVAVAVGLPRWYWTVVELPRVSRWVPVAVHETGNWVRGQMAAGGGAGGRVMTIDPLVAQEGGLAVYPEYATGRFIMHVGPFATATERQAHGLAWGPELAALLVREPPAAILYRVDLEPYVPGFVAYARAEGWQALDSPDGRYRLWRPAAGIAKQ